MHPDAMVTSDPGVGARVPATDGGTDRDLDADTLSQREIGLVLLLAAVPRLFGVHHVSLWLDEILSSIRVDLALPEAWEVSKGDPVHPPLSDLLLWFWFRVVDSEPLRRLLPAFLGVATIGLLVWLVSRWFGRRVAWATAWIAALSPLHVRYSQELRAYSLGLLAVVLAMAAADLALRRRRWSDWAVLGCALSLCYWSLYITVIVLLPVVLITLETVARRSTRNRDLTGLAGALLLSGLLFTPWLPAVGSAAAKEHELPATDWDLAGLGARWQFLTVGGVEGEPLSAGAVLFGAFVGAGTVLALGGSRGRSIVAGACAGSVGIEVILKLADHWSNGRYSLASWPFLVILAGLGCAAVARLATRLGSALAPAGWRGPVLGRAIAALPLAALLACEAIGLADYYRRGRPDWQSVARAASAMAAPDQPILTSNAWTRLSVGYYLARLEGAPQATISSRARILGAESDPGQLGPGCSVVVDSWWPKSETIEELLRETPAQLDFPRSGARVAAAAPNADDPQPWRCWPKEVAAAVGERPAPWLIRRVDRWRGSDASQIEFGADDQPRLRYGWSYPERTADGMTYRWAVGRWAAVDLGAGPASRLRLAAWSLADTQTLAVYARRRLLGTYPLTPARRTIDVPLPDDFAANGSEIVVFGFSRYASPEENPRPLAVGFDRVEALP